MRSFEICRPISIISRRMQYSENHEPVRPVAVEDHEGKSADDRPADVLVAGHWRGTSGKRLESGEQLVQGDQEPAAEARPCCVVVLAGRAKVCNRGRREDQIH